MRNLTLRRAERPGGMTSHSEKDTFTWVSSSVPILVNERTGRSGLSPHGGTWSPALPHQPGTPGLEVAGHGPRSLRCPRHFVPPRVTSSHVRSAPPQSPPDRGSPRAARLAPPAPSDPPPPCHAAPASPPAYSGAPRTRALPPAPPSVGSGRGRGGVPAPLDSDPLSLDQPGQDRLSSRVVGR